MENGTENETEDRPFVDYYDFLMISPTADRQMVDWAARLMLARFDPAKSESPDEEKYELVREAYKTLADPKRRAAFDRERSRHRLDPAGRVWETVSNQDVEDERQKRQAVMLLLYRHMMTNPRDPDVARNDLARLVGLPADDLEFAFWFLREQGRLSAGQGGAYAITAKGVEGVEDGDLPKMRKAKSTDTDGFQQVLWALVKGVSSGHVGPDMANGDQGAASPANASQAAAPAPNGAAALPLRRAAKQPGRSVQAAPENWPPNKQTAS